MPKETLALIDQVESWLEILDDSSYYELLGILEIADEEAIQRAFHEFSQAFHPDLHRGQPEQLRLAVTKIYQRGAEAYGVLRDPSTRASYDVALSQGQLRYNPGRSQSNQKDLSSLARTAGGRLHARQLERALGEQALEQVNHLFDKMMWAEGKNPELEAHARQLIQRSREGRLFGES